MALANTLPPDIQESVGVITEELLMEFFELIAGEQGCANGVARGGATITSDFEPPPSTGSCAQLQFPDQQRAT